MNYRALGTDTYVIEEALEEAYSTFRFSEIERLAMSIAKVNRFEANPTDGKYIPDTLRQTLENMERMASHEFVAWYRENIL